MEKFVAQHRSLVTGVLSGFDRLVFRGHLLPLVRNGGRDMYFFLEAAGVRLLDFKKFVLTTTERLKEASLLGYDGVVKTTSYPRRTPWRNS